MSIYDLSWNSATIQYNNSTYAAEYADSFYREVIFNFINENWRSYLDKESMLFCKTYHPEMVPVNIPGGTNIGFVPATRPISKAWHIKKISLHQMIRLLPHFEFAENHSDAERLIIELDELLNNINSVYKISITRVDNYFIGMKFYDPKIKLTKKFFSPIIDINQKYYGVLKEDANIRETIKNWSDKKFFSIGEDNAP